MALGTDLFAQLAGSRSNADFVRLVYRNVVGRDADAAALATFTGLLDSGAATQAELAVLACRSDFNTGSVELVGLADTGLAYQSVGG
jgi:serralysin